MPCSASEALFGGDDVEIVVVDESRRVQPLDHGKDLLPDLLRIMAGH